MIAVRGKYRSSLRADLTDPPASIAKHAIRHTDALLASGEIDLEMAINGLTALRDHLSEQPGHSYQARELEDKIESLKVMRV